MDLQHWRSSRLIMRIVFPGFFCQDVCPWLYDAAMSRPRLVQEDRKAARLAARSIVFQRIIMNNVFKVNFLVALTARVISPEIIFLKLIPSLPWEAVNWI
jgi:hypothetical protein